MLGSAIPKRWLVSLALVGLVSLFMASYSAVWASPASATTGTTVAPTPTPIPDSTKLAGLAPQGVASGGILTLAPGGGTWQLIDFLNEDGDILKTKDGIVATWSSSNTSCVTTSGSGIDLYGNGSKVGGYTTFANVDAAGSGCSATVSLVVTQHGTNTQNFSFTVNVNAIPSTPVPPPPVEEFVGTVALPTPSVPNEVVKEISAKDGGTVSTTTETGSTITLEVPGGGLDSGEGASVSVKPVTTSELPPPHPAAQEGSSSGTFKFGSSVVQITWSDKDGNAQDSKTLNKVAKVCMTATQAEADAAHGGIDGLGIWRHNGTNWVKLNSTVTGPVAGVYTICAFTSRFSPFAVGLDVAPPDAASAPTGLPATGDYSPSALTLFMAMLAGVALVVVGGFTARRARRVRERS